MIPPLRPNVRRLARQVLLLFIVTFVASRVLVLLIMQQRLPDLFLHLGGTHIHHLNFGIFLLAGLGAILVFVELPAPALDWAARLYGVALALTFDEFGMWLHLGGGYWQRASFDAVTVLTSLLALVSFAPPVRRWQLRGWGAAGLLLLTCLVFFWLLAASFGFAAREEPRLRQLEQHTPP
ncbi:MAG TPA: hypothetical protein VLB00_03820 [Gemmatimonadales bacterium]|nr:hypothetical protein [Gemmatimonadales bacterium]